VSKIVLETKFEDLKFFKNGKVRDIYDLGDTYLIVSTDRISAFDVIMSEGIPDKGKVLNKISEFWFNFSSDIIDNHIISTNVDDYPEITHKYRDEIEGRSMLVKKAELIPLECIVRSYITGSGLKDYQKTGAICGIQLPEGLVESQKLPELIFTPSTKAEIGDHDENITEEQAIQIVGEETYYKVKEATLKIFTKASEYAQTKGIILADTKMEFGHYNGEIIIIDELLTPDSSRFWPADKYEVGRSQQSYDKQFVRDYLSSIKFNKQPPAPTLPEEVIENTSQIYKDALQKLAGESL
jgi:phosphoribosylaminoimidazole-succinocarboxamide synthase